MEPDKSKRVRLSGGPEDSSSYAVIRGDGCLVIETYDFAEDSLGNRVVNGGVVSDLRFRRQRQDA